jgi:hypothetical protein
MAASKKAVDFREHAPLSGISQIEVQSIALSGKAEPQKVVVKQSSPGKWEVTDPEKHEASEAAVAEFLRLLKNAQVVEFHDGAANKLGDYKLSTPDLILTLDYGASHKPPSEEIAISAGEGAAEGKEAEKSSVHVAGNGTVWTIGVDLARTLARTPDFFRQKRFLAFPSTDAQSATFVGEHGTVELSRAGAEWKVNGKPADSIFVRQLLDNVSASEAIAFPKSGKDFGFDKPALKIVVHIGGEKDESAKGENKAKKAEKTIELKVGARADQDADNKPAYYALSSTTPDPFIISQELYLKLSPREETLLKSAVETPAVVKLPKAVMPR